MSPPPTIMAGVGVSFEDEQWFVVVSLCVLAGIGLLLSLVPTLRGRTRRRASAGG